MPIRFHCPHCRQRLSVSVQKAGVEEVCPRCKRWVLVPVPPAGESEATGDAAGGLSPAAPPADLPVGPPRLPKPPAPPVAAWSEPAANRATEGLTPAFLPEAPVTEPIELVLESATAAPPRRPAAHWIVVPRWVLITQGALLAAVGLAAFLLGLAAGRLGSAPPGDLPQAASLVGSVTYAAGPRRLPDAGAVALALPATREPAQDRVLASGLGPDDPPPDADHRGLAAILRLGGAYARADASGRFRLDLAQPGRHVVLVISRAKRHASGEQPSAADLRTLQRYLDEPGPLLGQQRYQVLQPLVRGPQRLDVVFGP